MWAYFRLFVSILYWILYVASNQGMFAQEPILSSNVFKLHQSLLLKNVETLLNFFILCFIVIIGRGFLTPLFFLNPPLYCLTPCFSNFVQPPSPTSTLTDHFVALFLWLTGLLCYILCVILRNNIMDLHMSSLSIIIEL